jgi:hypothetical protein
LRIGIDFLKRIEMFGNLMDYLGYTEVEVDQNLYPKPNWAINQVIRENGLVEDVCIHDVGHPNAEWLKIHDPDGSKGYGIHGCCGCCVKSYKR